ncbi:hypothetical protein F4679DRAFT_592751 [Xylaria curta]|nr:hypothetical protein F4679DRAFT_592751 [Xylaria curta]
MEFPAHLRGELKEDTPGSFSVGTEYVPSTTSESASLHMQQPYTPLSSRSTPAFYSMPMKKNQPDYGTSGLFGLTPPGSAFGGFAPEFKPESAQYLQSTDPRYLSKYPSPDPTLPSPLDLPQVPYYTNNSAYELSSLEWPADGPTRFITRQNVPLNEASLHINTLPALPAPLLYQARSNVEEVRQKSAALQRAQQGHIAKRKARASQNAYERPVTIIEAGLHKCLEESCENKRGFKRQEHLKRHVITVHLKQYIRQCPFCNARPFNRDDNFRQHIKLHCKVDGSGRTPYDPRAPAYLAELELRIKPRNNKKKAQRTQAASKAIADRDVASLEPGPSIEPMRQGEMLASVEPMPLGTMLSLPPVVV